MKTLKSRSLALVSGKPPENKLTVMSNDAFYVTRPPSGRLYKRPGRHVFRFTFGLTKVQDRNLQIYK